MLRWGFLEILFLRSWFSGWTHLPPTQSCPRGTSAHAQDEAQVEGHALEVRGLAHGVLDLEAAFTFHFVHFVTFL